VQLCPVQSPFSSLACCVRCVDLDMYLLTIRDGLHTRHIGPYASPKQAADDLESLLSTCGERARWQIHELETAPSALPIALEAA
jgi:hypothetical protein